ncbi:MAG: peptidylprolyl isomerase, partial [Casimicrobiaceae bacterium]
NPDIQRRIASETDRILSQAVIERDLAQWNAEFDARPDMATAARERWLAQPANYSAPEDVRLTQILYATSKYSRADARAKALDARSRIVAGADMGGIAKSESDDAATAQAGGKVDWTPVNHLDTRVSRVISTSLHNPGDLSQPIVTEAGVYLVRLDARRPGVLTPFDEAKASIMQDMRKEYVDTMRAKKMTAIRDDPSIVVNQPAVDALVVRIDPGFARKAVEGSGARAGRGEPKEPSPAK